MRVQKVWGLEEWIVNTHQYCGKRMTLNKGYQCSLHHHKVKHETFYVEKGEVLMQLGDEQFVMMPGDSIEIPVGAKHRFGGITAAVIFEFSTHHDDDDSYREPGEESRFNADLLK